MKTTYKATIFFDATEDDYKEGELPNSYGADWQEVLTADTKEELQQKITSATYQKDFTTIENDDVNEYDHASEYWTSYLANEENQGDASEREIELWRAGKCRLWAVNCHILISKVTEEAATL